MGFCGLVGLGTDTVHIHQLQRETDMTTTALKETERDSMRREDSSAQQCREFASLSLYRQLSKEDNHKMLHYLYCSICRRSGSEASCRRNDNANSLTHALMHASMHECKHMHINIGIAHMCTCQLICKPCLTVPTAGRCPHRTLVHCVIDPLKSTGTNCLLHFYGTKTSINIYIIYIYTYTSMTSEYKPISSYSCTT